MLDIRNDIFTPSDKIKFVDIATTKIFPPLC